MDESKLDPFTRNVLLRIDPEVKDSMTPAQFSAVAEAIKSHRPREHGIEARGVLPLFFARYYYVFLMGRDRRYATRRTEEGRRRKAASLARFLFVLLVFSPFWILLLVVLYLIKSSLGWDIFPGIHMPDLLR